MPDATDHPAWREQYALAVHAPARSGRTRPHRKPLSIVLDRPRPNHEPVREYVVVKLDSAGR